MALAQLTMILSIATAVGSLIVVWLTWLSLRRSRALLAMARELDAQRSAAGGDSLAAIARLVPHRERASPTISCRSRGADARRAPCRTLASGSRR
jgi:hypothetical protein